MIVTPVNDAPVAGDDTFLTNEDTPFLDTVAANDSDVDGGTLTYSLVGGPVAGLTLNADGSFNYAPPLNSNGPVTFTYQVADGKGGTDTATATINVNAVNDAPVAGDDSFTTKEDTTLNSKVSTNDSDVDGDTLTYSLVGGPIVGLTFNPDGTFSYSPPPDFNGPVTFDYQVDDGKGGTDTATVTINVTPVNDAPTDITLDNSTVDEETDAAIVGVLTVTDPDDAPGSHNLTVDDTRFEIVAGQLQLKSGATLDFRIRTDRHGSDNGKGFRRPYALRVVCHHRERYDWRQQNRYGSLRHPDRRGPGRHAQRRQGLRTHWMAAPAATVSMAAMTTTFWMAALAAIRSTAAAEVMASPAATATI